MVQVPKFPMATDVLKRASQDEVLNVKVDNLIKTSEPIVKKLQGKAVWMVNSTASGGGVAEMMPSMLKIFEELGMDVRWVVIETTEEKFFDLTKRLHNSIHGQDTGPFSTEDSEVYLAVNKENFKTFLPKVSPQDIVVIHDPQPLPLAKFLKENLPCPIIWRSHIGLPEQNGASKAAWDFLLPYFDYVDQVVFSDEAYIPPQLKDKTSYIIKPSIDPLATKNKPLSNEEHVQLIEQSNLTRKVEYVGEAGELEVADLTKLVGTEVILQVSRWDNLKGWKPLIDGFRKAYESSPEALRDVQLVLAGPEPSSVADDPEGLSVWQDIVSTYVNLPNKIKMQVLVLSLPVFSREENHLIVNAVQRLATFIVQNSIREGFGLTITEAMWKGKPVLGSTAFGCKQQIKDDVNGFITEDPADAAQVAENLVKMLLAVRDSSDYGKNARDGVYKDFLMFRQINDYVTILGSLD